MNQGNYINKKLSIPYFFFILYNKTFFIKQILLLITKFFLIIKFLSIYLLKLRF